MWEEAVALMVTSEVGCPWVATLCRGEPQLMRSELVRTAHPILETGCYFRCQQPVLSNEEAVLRGVQRSPGRTPLLGSCAVLGAALLMPQGLHGLEERLSEGPVAWRLQVLIRPFARTFVSAWTENWKVAHACGQ